MHLLDAQLILGLEPVDEARLAHHVPGLSVAIAPQNGWGRPHGHRAVRHSMPKAHEQHGIAAADGAQALVRLLLRLASGAIARTRHERNAASSTTTSADHSRRRRFLRRNRPPGHRRLRGFRPNRKVQRPAFHGPGVDLARSLQRRPWTRACGVERIVEGVEVARAPWHLPLQSYRVVLAVERPRAIPPAEPRGGNDAAHVVQAQLAALELQPACLHGGHAGASLDSSAAAPSAAAPTAARGRRPSSRPTRAATATSATTTARVHVAHGARIVLEPLRLFQAEARALAMHPQAAASFALHPGALKRQIVVREVPVRSAEALAPLTLKVWASFRGVRPVAPLARAPSSF